MGGRDVGYLASFPRQINREKPLHGVLKYDFFLSLFSSVRTLNWFCQHIVFYMELLSKNLLVSQTNSTVTNNFVPQREIYPIHSISKIGLFSF
jgi:hypothetical protein